MAWPGLARGTGGRCVLVHRCAACPFLQHASNSNPSSLASMHVLLAATAIRTLAVDAGAATELLRWGPLLDVRCGVAFCKAAGMVSRPSAAKAEPVRCRPVRRHQHGPAAASPVVNAGSIRPYRWLQRPHQALERQRHRDPL